jgi:putative CocE/NonD family hydrolase
MSMRICLFFVFIFFSGLAQDHPLNVIREQVMIPMRDGVNLGAIVYRPEGSGKYPVLVYRTPYGAEDYDRSAQFPRKAAKQGYVIFLVDVRGRFLSEGEFEAYRNEKSDGYDLIEWCAARPYSNGKVGTYGGSYPGIAQWQAMAEHPPHLAAAAPEMTPIGSHDFMYYGGAFSHPWLDWFMPYIFGDKRRRAGDTSGPWTDEESEAAWNQMDRKSFYNFRPLDQIPIMKKYAPEYFEWLHHPDSSSWWDFLNTSTEFKKFKAPVFLESGWYDAAYGPKGASVAFNKMRNEAASAAARDNTILMLGPWNHTSLNVFKTKFGEVEFGPNAGFDYDAALLKWFDVQLKGLPADQAFPRVSIFVMGENKWRAENEWPLTRRIETHYSIHTAGSVPGKKTEGSLMLRDSFKKSVKNSDSFIFDPSDPAWDKSYEKSYPYDHREIEKRSDVMIYTSQPLEHDMEVTGEVVVDLYVRSEAKDTDFTFTLCDVFPDGTSVNLHGLDAGYLRMRYRNGKDRQELMKPGEVYKIRIGDVYTSNLFKKGHRIRLTVSSSIAPHYDPNPNTGTEIASESVLKPVVNSILSGPSHPSVLILPVIPAVKKDAP